MPTPHLQLKVNNLESEYRIKILLAKSNYESQLIQSFAGSHNSKIYDFIRTLCKDSSIPPVVSLNNSNVTFDTDKTELFNTLFHSVFTGSSFSLPDMSTQTVLFPCHLHAYALYLLQTLKCSMPFHHSTPQNQAAATVLVPN
jgi:hypothetical protein